MKYNFSDQSSRKAAVILIVAYEKKKQACSNPDQIRQSEDAVERFP